MQELKKFVDQGLTASEIIALEQGETCKQSLQVGKIEERQMTDIGSSINTAFKIGIGCLIIIVATISVALTLLISHCHTKYKTSITIEQRSTHAH